MLLLLLELAITALDAHIALIPTMRTVNSSLNYAMLSTFAILALLIAKRIRPSWRGVRMRSKVLYVLLVVVAQAMVVAGAEACLYFAGGGLQLFQPSFQASFTAPDGRSAHVYREGFGCGYTVYVSEPWSVTMVHSFDLPRQDCSEPTPRVEWKQDGGVRLIDRAGSPLQRQASPPLFHVWSGGC